MTTSPVSRMDSIILPDLILVAFKRVVFNGSPGRGP